MLNSPLLEVEDLEVVFPTPRGIVRAVRGISFTVRRGQMFGIVGESGCGKTATGRAILGLVPPPGRIAGGRILFDGQDLTAKVESEISRLRGSRISMIFQDPAAALNPLFTVGQQLTAVMRHHRIAAGAALNERAAQLLGDLGLPRPEEMLRAYSHQLSGGQQQRVMIAIALCAEPDLVIADEPTSCLDVTIQSQILDLLVRLQQARQVAVLLITHDLGVIAQTCEEVAVLYLGRVVEQGPVRALFQRTKHPYTLGLLAALPVLSRWGAALKVIPGTVPTPLTAIPGCSFASRCDSVMEVCRRVPPPRIHFGDGHSAACHLYSDGTGSEQGGRS